MRRKIFGVLGIIIGLSMLSVAAYQTYEHYRIAKYGVETDIEASSAFEQHRRFRGGVEFFAMLNFRTQSGNTVTVHRRVSTSIKEKFDTSGILRLKYLPENPGKIILADDSALELLVMSGMGLFLLIGGVNMLIRPAANKTLGSHLK
jgi:hypothetical protein